MSSYPRPTDRVLFVEQGQGPGSVLHVHSVANTLLSEHFGPQGGFTLRGYNLPFARYLFLEFTTAEHMLTWGLRAAGMRLPFLPTRVGLGTDVMTYNPEFKTITSPYADGEVLLAMPALNLDVALIHVNRSDRLGNTQIDGPDPYFDDQFARAAEKCFVSTEELVDRMDFSHPDTAKQNLFERYLVAGIIVMLNRRRPVFTPESP